jgi:DNA-binding NtrC family response regulator
MAKLLLLGLEHSLTEDLHQALTQLGHRVQLATLNSSVLETTDADLIFAASADLRAILRTRTDVPVVVTSRLPEVSAWLDALQDGAADYCGAPFEATQLGWILNSTLGCGQARAAA